MSHLRAIETNQAPKAIGPYSQGIECDGWIFCSGQIPLDPSTGAVIAGGIEAQTKQVLENLRAVLHAGGVDLSSVVSVTIYLKDFHHFSTVNEIYSLFFLTPFPARATVEVSRLPKDVLIEVSVIAKKNR